MKKLQDVWSLTNANIDFISSQLQEFLQDNDVEPREITRLRLSLEDVLLQWKSYLTENAKCSVNFGRRFWRPYVQLKVPGLKINPYEIADTSFGDGSTSHNLLASLGLVPSYSYTNGNNILTLRPPKKKLNPLIPLFLAIVLALIAGQFFTLVLDPPEQEILAEQVLTPLFATFIRLINLLAGLMIFFSVVWGIVGIGDINILGTVGKKLISRILLFTSGTAVLTLCTTLWFYPLDLSAGISPASLARQIWQLLLAVVPGDFISPFQSGNSLQIIFMAVGLGLFILIRGERVEDISRLTSQINSLFQLGMAYISSLAPYLIFVCLLQMSLTDLKLTGWAVVKIFLLGTCTEFLVQLLFTSRLIYTTRISLGKLGRSLMPIYLAALSTASAAAVFSDNRRCCIQQLGIKEKFADFGMPLMQTLLKTGAVTNYLILSLGMAELFNVPISPSWVLVATLLSILLALASPPVPGSLSTCLTILFFQLGIPIEALAISIPLAQVMNFQVTATNIWSDITGLAITAQALGMQDQKILRQD